jgi:hypothetical protein
MDKMNFFTTVEKSKILKMRVEFLIDFLEHRYDSAKKTETSTKINRIQILLDDIKNDLGYEEPKN